MTNVFSLRLKLIFIHITQTHYNEINKKQLYKQHVLFLVRNQKQ